MVLPTYNSHLSIKEVGHPNQVLYAYVPRSIGNGIDYLYIKVRGSNCLPIYSNKYHFLYIPMKIFYVLPRYESQCSTVQEQQCSTVNEQKCTTVQVRPPDLFVNVIVLDFFVHETTEKGYTF